MTTSEKAFQAGADKKESTSPGGTRRRGTYRLGRLLPKAAREALRRQGFVESAVVTRWSEVVGESMARSSQPTRLNFPRGKHSDGTLYISVDGPFATELQHFEPLLLEKVNAFYGFRAVARIAITQCPLPEKKTPAKTEPVKLSATDESLLAKIVNDSGDADLHDAIERLGRQILGDRKQVPARKSALVGGRAVESE